MRARETNQQIDAAAARWAARLDSDQFSFEEEKELEAWLAQDSRRLGAFARARAVNVRMERARALGPHFDPTSFSTDNVTSRPSRRRVITTVAAAATASVAALAVVTNLHRKIITTEIGEIHVEPLDDGSVVTVNTASEIAVHFTKNARRIWLLKGEALFDVAKDPSRPFIVEAGDTGVRAVGTSFTVRLLSGQPLNVLVREGTIEIDRPNLPTQPVRVTANSRAIAFKDAPVAVKRVAPAEINLELAWQVGRIAFEGTTLRDAAATFARYSDTRIVIDDPIVANKLISGLFMCNDPVGFSRAVALSLKLRAEKGTDFVRLSRA